MAPPISDADNALITQLFQLSKRNKKLVSSSTYPAPNLPEMTIRSWKMNEFKYYDVPSPFPTLARGLFTTWVSQSEDDQGETENSAGNGKYRIVARGYDKFFNIGEVPWTFWQALEEHTVGPYAMTLKSNGCIIFIAALTPTTLVETSKHSLGPVTGVPVSHAQMGEQWLHRHLQKAGKTAEEFAKVLWDNNLTAVAELCDDSFEEHVLPYSAELTGLHLHGLNESTGAFRTRSSEEVAAFAREWGFIETAWHTVQTIADVKAFSEEVSKTGKWNGQPIEGFVVRCHVSQEPGKDQRSAPPYPPGSSFFFKVKYDEPYMMYRDWREVTKILLSAKGPLEEVKLPKSKLKRPETKTYIEWVKREIRRDRSLFEGYNKGKGIIATRERFLQWRQQQGNDIDDLVMQTSELDVGDGKQQEFAKTLIIPVAIPGCGKTTIAVALKHLFAFGHVQSDDVQAKKAAPQFIKKVMEELQTHNVVIADKNNHLRKHREDLAEAVKNYDVPVRRLALNWALDKPPAMIHRICADRIVQRGDNHQTLRADAEAKKHEDVLWMFINNTEELAEDEVHEVVDMDIEDDIESGLARAVDACVRILGLEKPSQEEIGQALAAARAYKATQKQEGKKQKAAKPRYYAFLPEINLKELIDARMSSPDVPEQVAKFWSALEKGKRISTVPHITIVHTKSLPDEQALWDRCENIFLHSPAVFDIELGEVLCDNRVMAITVKSVKPHVDPGEDTNTNAEEFVKELGDELKHKLHITVGTGNANIAPFEARALVKDWKKGRNKDRICSVTLENIIVKGGLKGLFS